MVSGSVLRARGSPREQPSLVVVSRRYLRVESTFDPASSVTHSHCILLYPTVLRYVGRVPRGAGGRVDKSFCSRDHGSERRAPPSLPLLPPPPVLLVLQDHLHHGESINGPTRPSLRPARPLRVPHILALSPRNPRLPSLSTRPCSSAAIPAPSTGSERG